MLTVVLLPGCGRGRRVQEIAYVSAPQAILRDQVAAVYNKAGVVRNAERVQVLDRDRRFARVRTSSGAEGWIEQRYLVNQNVYDSCQNMTKDSALSPFSRSMRSPMVTKKCRNIWSSIASPKKVCLSILTRRASSPGT